VLERGYQVHGKDISSVRAAGLAQSVAEWFTCPHRPGREMGWVTVEASDYVRPLHRLALRWRLRNGQWKYALLLSTLAPREVMQLLHQPVDRVKDQRAVAAAYAKLYDLRGGAVEIEFKEDKQGFGMTKRSKKKFAARTVGDAAGSVGAQCGGVGAPVVKPKRCETGALRGAPLSPRCVLNERLHRVRC